MRATYSILFIVLILALIGCTLLAKRSDRPCRRGVMWLDISLILPLAGSLIRLVTENRTAALIGHYFHYIGIDIALVSLVSFTNTYCQGIGDGNRERKPTVMYLMLTADMIQLFLNPFFGHAFGIEPVSSEGAVYYKLVPYAGQVVHRVVDYFIFFCVLLIYIIAAKKTPKVYRERFTVLLFSLAAAALLQGYYIIAKSTYDRSVIGYSVIGLIVFYFAVIYRPLRLLDSMLSNIISDMSDAFYIFDPSGKCIWANDQGCKLVGFSKKNYEDITAKLVEMFGDYDAPADQFGKKSIGEGDNIRFYTLEDKLVKDDNGQPNGSYLRIQDVTEEELEIKVRDEQIGQISQEAYKDALTGVGNKAAYNNRISELNAQIAAGLTEFAVVMADMNNLKQINDEYGHKAGDLYIRGCCHMICEAFKHSPIFRIGGDEFAVIVQGQDYDERLERLKTLRSEFERSFEQQDTDPWLRCSAAVGMAEHAFDDNSFELVFKRADKAMYEDKKQFKEKYGITR